MIFPGRPRHSRDRYPCGQIRPQDSGITRTQLQRLRAISRDPWLASVVGQMLFLGELSQLEAEVCWEIGKLTAKYDQAMGRRRYPASPAYEAGYGRAEQTETPEQATRNRASVARYDRLMAELDYLDPGHKTIRILEALCVGDQLPEPGTLGGVRNLLRLLAKPLDVRPQYQRDVRRGRPSKRA